MLRSGVPAAHVAFGIEHVDRIVAHAAHEQTQPRFAGAQRRLRLPAVGDVDPRPHDLGRPAGGIAQQSRLVVHPMVRAVLAAEPVLRGQLVVGEQGGHFGEHPDDRARVLSEMPALFANDQLTTEYRFRGKDGAYHWVHDEARLLRDAAGRPTEVVGSWVDITDRRQAETSLRASEARLRLLVGSVRDYAIYMLDPEGHVRSWNAGAQHIKGYTESEILGQHFSRFYTPEDVAAGRPDAALQVAAAHGQLAEEAWRVRKDGSRFWADVLINAVRDDRGALVGFAKVTRDLTERKRAEQALRASEERFRILAVTANDAILSADSHGNITYFNPGAERIFGYAAEEVSGRPLTTLMPERFEEAHRAGLARYLATREARVIGRTVELAGRRKDGTEFPLELSLAAWNQGAEVAFTVIIRDIT